MNPLNRYVLRAAILGTTIWIALTLIRLPEYRETHELLAIQPNTFRLVRDEVNWRAAAGESVEEKWARQTELQVELPDGRVAQMSCAHIEPLCMELSRSVTKKLTLWLLPRKVDDRYWVMRANLDSVPVLSSLGQQQKLSAIRTTRIVFVVAMLLLTAIVFRTTGEKSSKKATPKRITPT